MDVDDVIARHKARLDEHRNFLDSEAIIPSAPSDSQYANNTINNDSLIQNSLSHINVEETLFSPLPVKPITHDRSSASPVLSSKKHHDRNSTKLQRCQSAMSESEEKRLQRQRELYINQTLALDAADAVHRKKAAAGAHNNINNNNNNNNTDISYRASSGPVAFYGYTGFHEQISEEERLFAAQLRAAARYFVSKPEAMYHKSQLWLEGRERARERRQQESERGGLEECSFQPKLRSPSRRPRHTHHTHTNTNTNTNTSSTPHMSISEEASVAAHLERLAAARRQREAAGRRQRGGKIVGSWSGRVTVPRGFAFARGVAPIPALRQPITAAGAALRGNITLAREEKSEGARKGRDKDKEEEEEEEEEEGREIVKESMGNSQLCQQQHQLQKEEEEEEKENKRNDRPSPRGRRRKAKFQEEQHQEVKEERKEYSQQQESIIANLRSELEEKDKLLQEQKSEILLLRRELEVAKSIVQRLSLQDITQEEKKSERNEPAPG